MAMEATGKLRTIFDTKQVSERFTKREFVLEVVDGNVVADTARDVLKIAVVDRHHAGPNSGVGFVRGWTTYLTHPPSEFSNLWVIRLDRDGRAHEFTEWWMEAH